MREEGGVVEGADGVRRMSNSFFCLFFRKSTFSTDNPHNSLKDDGPLSLLLI